jgi:hypothetical protein
MKGQFMLISSVVIGLILISTASTVSEIQSRNIELKDGSYETNHIRSEASKIDIYDESERENFRDFLNSIDRYEAVTRFDKKQLCFDVTLYNNRNRYNLECVGNNSIQLPLDLIFEIDSGSKFDNKGNYDWSSADRADRSGNLGIGYLDDNYGSTLAVFWRLDRISGNVRDYSGNGYSGTTSNFDGDERGRSGVFFTNSFRFDGVDDSVSTSGTPSISGAVSTVAYWAYFPSTSQKVGARVLQIGGGPNSNPTSGITHVNNPGGAGSDKLMVEHWDSGSAEDLGTVDVKTDSWNFITHVTDGDKGWIYVNGDLKGSGNATRGNDPTEPLNIGEGDDKAWKGRIDELLIHDANMSKSTVREFYFSGTTGDFEASYKTDTINLASGQSVSAVSIKSMVTTGTSAELHIRHSSGSTDTVKLDKGKTHRNYTVSIPDTGGSITIEKKLSSSTEKSTPVIEEIRAWGTT